MSSTKISRTKGARLAIAAAAALLIALVFQLTLPTKPAQAICSPDPCPINHPPFVHADNSSVTVDEGDTATNTGTFGDPDDDGVTISTSAGTVTQDNDNQTWSWSYATEDGPAQSGTVTITAKDSGGRSAKITFSLTVNNVKPTATFNTPASANRNSSFDISLDNPSDPSSTDKAAGFSYAFDCGSGYGAFGSASKASCTANSSGSSQTVKGKIKDKDGGETEYVRSVEVKKHKKHHKHH